MSKQKTHIKHENQKIQPSDEGRSGWQIAEEAGIDMSLLEESLAKTVEERLRENSRALALIEALEEAMKRHG